MITHHGTKPMFGLPHASPFAFKVETLLRMSGLPYRTVMADLRKAPKGKIPWIDDDGMIVADSTFIRKHLEERHGIDFSGGYDAATLAAGFAFERLAEDHLYWLIIENRWLQPDNFDKGPRRFFDVAPALIRPLIIRMIVKKVQKACHAHGIGRLSDEERLFLARRDLDSLDAFLAGKQYLLGDTVSGADATVHAMAASIVAPHFRSPYADHGRKLPHLMAYIERMNARFYPARPD